MDLPPHLTTINSWNCKSRRLLIHDDNNSNSSLQVRWMDGWMNGLDGWMESSKKTGRKKAASIPRQLPRQVLLRRLVVGGVRPVAEGNSHIPHLPIVIEAIFWLGSVPRVHPIVFAGAAQQPVSSRGK